MFLTLLVYKYNISKLILVAMGAHSSNIFVISFILKIKLLSLKKINTQWLKGVHPDSTDKIDVNIVEIIS